jgi:hypothetical protein
MKTAINPATISIQYWPSKPSNEKRLIRNCTVPVPNFGQSKRLFVQHKHFGKANILFLYFRRADLRSFALR